MEETGFTLEGRVLCSNDACIGVVGPDGKCKACGLVYQGDEIIGADEADLHPATADELKQTVEPAERESASSLDPGERVCCPDEACIGVIGADGRCGICGKPG